jgi:hypothetical protein
VHARTSRRRTQRTWRQKLSSDDKLTRGVPRAIRRLVLAETGRGHRARKRREADRLAGGLA